MNQPKLSGLLIKLPQGAGAALAGPALSAAGAGFTIEPLFTTTPPSNIGGALAALPGPSWQWFVARPSASVEGANPWELAHEAIAPQLGLGPGSPVFAEPDLVQEWPYENPLIRDSQFAAAEEICAFNDQIQKLPRGPAAFAWHLGDDFSQLLAARASAGAPGAGGRIRIAHLDTGYDRNHATFPKHVRLDLQRNFMDDQSPKDAHDPGARGILKNPGHGTGTLGILAGNRFRFAANGQVVFDDFVGGAPEAEIVPLRVGKSVVQLLTSSVAAGISYAADLCNDTSSCVHVMSMSMGGVASQAWAEAVNKAYEAGILYVAAAGNNFSAGFFGFPTRSIVYPARFRRVIAACGVMANARPYYGLSFGTMQGNFGPASKMATALSAYTPNIPWAEIGCEKIVDMDGQGTSAATPQIAAAAALYLQKHRVLFDATRYPEAWMRVEAVRQALFTSADKSADGGSSEKLGNGILQAERALAMAPPPATSLQRTREDNAALPFLRVLTGLGVATNDASHRMLALEATQLTQSWGRTDVPNPVESVLSDPDVPADAISPVQRRQFLEALSEHPQASRQLKQHVKAALNNTPAPPATGKRKPVPRGKKVAASELDGLPAQGAPAGKGFVPPPPPFRRLRGFAIDPSLSTKLDTAPVSTICYPVPWENVQPGPVGEYLEVIDLDPASKCCYEPVNLDHPILLAQDGLPPSEGTPQFHQQMVYAVASLTINNFERALGRRTLWRPGPSPNPKNPKDDSFFVRRLRVHPHALRERNAYYSPQKIALLFGYFNATTNVPDEHMAGGMVFTCLSHDIIAHETTHALLDGMNRCFLRPSNPDVHAFHEAFADLVALFQHFTFPEILRHQISATRGSIRNQQNFLGELAGEFGRGAGMRQALRDAIGKTENGVWKPHQPNPAEYQTITEPHARGAILVAAVFDAFLSIYERRIADLVRLASDGTGILRPGAIHPDLVQRMADEAAKSAHHVLAMCIRALDYCPPADITFGEFLRAIITADYDLVEDDDLNYRVSFIEAFRRRGIYPPDVRTLSVSSLLWRGPHNEGHGPSQQLQDGLARLRSYADDNVYTDSREKTFHLERTMRREIHRRLREHFESVSGPADAAYLGLDPARRFEVRSARFAYRTSPDGGMQPQLILGLLQQEQVPVDPADPNGDKMRFEGGCTVVADLRESRIRYCIRKNVNSKNRLARQQEFAMAARETLRATYLGARPLDDADDDGEPFALLHRGL